MQQHLVHRFTPKRRVVGSPSCLIRRPSGRPVPARAPRRADRICYSKRKAADAASPPEAPDTDHPSSRLEALISNRPKLAPVALERAAPMPVEEAPMGLTYYSDGSATFRVWAPHAAAASLLVSDTLKAPRETPPKVVKDPADVHMGLDYPDTTPIDDTPRPAGAAGGQQAPRNGAKRLEEQPPTGKSVQLERQGDVWGISIPPGALPPGTAYQVALQCHDGTTLHRRDPYARQTDYNSCWCYAVDPSTYQWQQRAWQPPSFDQYMIYEMQVGSFTPEGTLRAASARLQHVADCGFTAVQLMPIAEHSDAWGYNPRQLLSLNGAYGTPDELRLFVDRAHQLGLAVIVDVVLHHGAPEGNMLWAYDGWNQDNNGGIYHEGAPDTEWGRQFAFWKREVVDMVTSACVMWLNEYRVDGLRFDSANDLPNEAVQAITWQLHNDFPGRLLTAEITPENPRGVHELGFDALWVHSGYFDIIQQHRALGRGHHGGGDWAAGWDLERLRTAMGLHYGFTHPTQCVKYMTGSHDQVGCRHGGKWYADYQLIGGQHRYAVDQYGGGRTDGAATAAARCWWAANIAAAGLPMMFMGTEVAQSGWWDTDPWHGFNWANSEDDIGKHMMAAVGDACRLRLQYPALRYGWANTLHEDRPNGVMAYERVVDGEERIVAVVNAGRNYWLGGEYGVYVGSTGIMEEVYCSQAPRYGGFEGMHSNTDVDISDGRIYINLPPTCTLFFRHKSL